MKLTSNTSVEFKTSNILSSLPLNAKHIQMIAPGASCCTLGSCSCSCGAVNNN